MRHGGAKTLLLTVALALPGSGGREEESEPTTLPTTTSTSTTTTSTTTTTIAPTTTAPRRAPTTTATPSPPRQSGNYSAAYPDFCIPPAPPDLDCADVGGDNFTVRPPDPHRFDADGDGVGCES
ncbi:MAG TPA: hypothetical protein VG078_11105 [Acidimicrobiales bacterium]|nr:hypothetical protein [Acidimicrobiales bacterium]